MKISFENFGVIDKGEIEQKPLTILCGENNTGKTYAMYAMYFKKTLTDLAPKFDKFFKEKIPREKYNSNPITIDVNDIFSTKDDLKTLINSFINTHLSSFFSASKDIFASNAIDIKDIELNNLIHNFYKKPMPFSMKPTGFEQPLLIINKESHSYNISITHHEKGSLNYDAFIHRLSNEFTLALLGSYGRNTLLFPAERAGLNLFYTELNAYRVNLLHNFNQNNLIISKYPKPIADYIDWLNFIPNYKNQTSQLFSTYSTTLQNNILGGNYSLDETNSINFHLNNGKGNLPLHLTSSTVKTYFGLWFYLQHMAQEGDVLMIDEPELSLHPKNQRNIARLFAQLVNKGIKIVISTHSDYIVKEISNLIMLSQQGKQRDTLMQRFNVQEDEVLKPEQVGAYLFKNNTITPMEISAKEGIIATTFDEVIRDLSEESQTIFYEYLDEDEDA